MLVKLTPSDVKVARRMLIKLTLNDKLDFFLQKYSLFDILGGKRPSPMDAQIFCNCPKSL